MKARALSSRHHIKTLAGRLWLPLQWKGIYWFKIASGKGREIHSILPRRHAPRAKRLV